MSRWLLAVAFYAGCTGLAAAQVGNQVNSGLNSNNGAISAGTIDRVNGINANGVPRQQSPGASMTNGAGNSAMTPNIAGAPPASPPGPGTGVVTPTINGQVAPPTE